jgi:transposase-like protein
MEQIPRQQYTKEFREQAVRLVLERQVTILEAARRLSMSGKTLKNWVGKRGVASLRQWERAEGAPEIRTVW